jgi:hypothetical protein
LPPGAQERAVHAIDELLEGATRLKNAYSCPRTRQKIEYEINEQYHWLHQCEAMELVLFRQQAENLIIHNFPDSEVYSNFREGQSDLRLQIDHHRSLLNLLLAERRMLLQEVENSQDMMQIALEDMNSL